MSSSGSNRAEMPIRVIGTCGHRLAPAVAAEAVARALPAD
jgi:hypothetical protein